MRGTSSGFGPTIDDAPGAPALEGLFRREYEPMHRLAFTLLRSDVEAEEVVQDAFLAMAGRLDAIDNAGGYLRTSVVNGVRRRLDRRRRLREIEQRADGGGEVTSEYLVDLVEALPERERIAIVLRYYAGWNATEIGEVLGCPASTVRSLLHRALDRLREMLRHE